jgi:hypothetical protein
VSKKRKTVFISYSWDNPEHQDWVLNLAKDLMSKYGLNVILDQFELSAGKDLTFFMESSIEKADKVLVILTPNYKNKAEERKSGVGYETSMITQEIFESPISKVKFIPILRDGTLATSAPKFLKSKLYHPMNKDSFYVNKLFKLSRIVYEKPLLEKPELGDIPDFSNDKLDPIIDIANSVLNEEKINKEIDSILHSKDGVQMFREEALKLNFQIKEKSDLYKEHTKIPFTYESDNRESAIIHALGYSVSFYWKVAYSNSTRDSNLIIKYWKGCLRLNSWNAAYWGEEPKTVKELNYSFDLDYDKEIQWKINNDKFSTDELMQSAFLFIIEQIKKEKSKKFRK